MSTRAASNSVNLVWPRAIAVALAVACLGSVGVTQAAAAEMHTTTQSITLSYDASRLAAKPAAEKLYARIQLAARQVCGTADLRDLRAARYVARCRDSAIASAVASAASPQLLAVHREATGKDDSIRLAATDSRG